jgi:hypothetical protein
VRLTWSLKQTKVNTASTMPASRHSAAERRNLLARLDFICVLASTDPSGRHFRLSLTDRSKSQGSIRVSLVCRDQFPMKSVPRILPFADYDAPLSLSGHFHVFSALFTPLNLPRRGSP